MTNFLLGTIGKEVPGSDLKVDCLWCQKEGVVANVRERVEWLMLFHFFPLFRKRTVFLRCSSCERDMIAKCSLEELAQSNPLTLKQLLVKRISLVGETCVILGLVLCWAFWIGLIPAIIGFYYGRKYGSWMKKWGSRGLILNLLSPVIFLALYLVIDLISK